MSVSQHRGVVVAQNGIVAASQPLAVSAGLDILMRGGSFADAAIATSAVLCVTEPYASQIGGDAFLIVYDAKTGRTTALNGSGIAPQAATPDRFPDGIPLRGLPAAAVPGLVDAWFALHERWGTRPLADLLAPALRYAADGFPAGYRYSQAFANNAPTLQAFPETLAALAGGAMPQPGKIIRQPDLAWTLRQIAEGGRDAFYAGPVAERIVRHSER
ncbi:MAG TPA: gamma-glutamyltransferase, partial [Chthonomonadaceae bacterium]|nr:gamma-glutamyltransferase [Chthonomonadaceae bacterium]